MFKDGKIFGKINILDFAVILLVILLVIIGSIKFKTFDNKVDASALTQMRYTFLINNVRDYTANAYKVGDEIFDAQTNNSIGIITNVESLPAETDESLMNGKTRIIKNPYKRDIILTVDTMGTVTDTGYFANKSIELKVSSEKKIETKYATSTGKVGSIVIVEGE